LLFDAPGFDYSGFAPRSATGAPQHRHATGHPTRTPHLVARRVLSAGPPVVLVLSAGRPLMIADLVEQVAGVTGLTKRDVGVVVDLLLETISKALCEKEHIEIRGFGSFKVKTKKARMARNPRTGAQVQVPEKTVPYFKASRELVKLIDSM